MRTVYKFPLPSKLDDTFALDMPSGAKPVRFALQGGRATLWAEVDTDQATESRPFAVIGTGHPIPDGAAYIGSWEAGPFVWHLYDTQGVATA